MITKRRRVKPAVPEHADEVSPEEGWRLFDEEARRCLGMSGDHFLRLWDAGAIDPNEPERHSAIMRVVMLLPFARPHARV